MGRIEEGRRKEIGTIERSEWTRGGKRRLFEVGRNPDARKKERERTEERDRIGYFDLYIYISFQFYPFSILRDFVHTYFNTRPEDRKTRSFAR